MKDRNHGGVEFSGLSLVAVSNFGEEISAHGCAINKGVPDLPQGPIGSQRCLTKLGRNTINRATHLPRLPRQN